MASEVRHGWIPKGTEKASGTKERTKPEAEETNEDLPGAGGASK